MSDMKHCVISLATRDKNYLNGLKRLEESLKRVGFDGDFIYWSDEYPPGSPAQLETPFAFKIFCFMEARKRGYELILWIDPSGVVIRPLDPIFERMEKEGYAIFKNGRIMLGQWCSDVALKSSGMTREESLKIPEINAAVIGLNMKNEKAVEFFNKWHAWAMDGVIFRGIEDKILNEKDYEDIKYNIANRVSNDPRVFGHRYDQSAAGIIAYQLGMKLLPDGVEHYYSHFIRRATVILIERGFVKYGKRTSVNRLLIDKYLSYLLFPFHKIFKIFYRFLMQVKGKNG